METDWRLSERRLRTDPHDAAAVLDVVVGRRRAGLPVPGDLVGRVVSPGRTVESGRKLEVWILTPRGELRCVGRTGPGTKPVVVPEHRALWVEPFRFPPLDETLAATKALQVPGLALNGSKEKDAASALARVSELPLVDLSLVRWNLRGDALGALARMPLERFALYECKNVRLEPLGALSSIADLELYALRDRSPNALEALARLENLSRVRLELMNAAPLEALARLPRLKRLELRHAIGVADPELFGGLTRLERLYAGQSIEGLHRFVHLEALAAGDGPGRLAGLDSLERLRKLHLDVLPDRGDELAREVARLPDLEELSMSFTRVGLDALRSLTRLERLGFPYRVGAEVTSAIGAFVSLRELDLSRLHVGPEAIAAAASLPRLERLWMREPDPSSAPSLAPLAGARGLRELSLAGWIHLTDDDLAVVASLPRLERFDLSRATRVTDAGLRKLGGVASLRELSVWLMPQIKRAVYKELARSLPACTVRVETDIVAWVSFGKHEPF